jgi:sec-independent protein translocase protein TatA
MSPLFGFLSAPAPTEMIVLLVIAVLLFGQNLPEVARKIGKSFMEFKRAMKNIEDEIRAVTSELPSGASARLAITKTSRPGDLGERDEPTAPKFEPPAG